MVAWRFLDYWPREGFDPMRVWEATQDDDVRARLDAVLDVLAQTENWLDPNVKGLFRLLDRAEAGLGEIVFETSYTQEGRKKKSGRKFRVFVELRVDEHDCVMFVGSEKQRGTYSPPDAPRLAYEYLRALKDGEGFTDGHI